MSGAVRDATTADMPLLMEIQRRTLEAPQWSEAVWRECFAPNAMRAARVVLVAELQAAAVGFVVLRVMGPIAELESLAVAQSARRCGLGRTLCGEVLRRAREWGVSAVELEVRASNVAALGLYRALGFVQQGVRYGYYQGPREDAVLMALELDGTAGSGGVSQV